MFSEETSHRMMQFAPNHPEKKQPQDDCFELLELKIFFLEGTPSYGAKLQSFVLLDLYTRITLDEQISLSFENMDVSKTV